MTVTHPSKLPLTRILGVILTMFVLSGCAEIGRVSSPTRYYVIQPVRSIIATVGALGTDAGISFGIGPILIPGYADRQQIVTFESGSKLKLAEFDQWAEPLTDNIQRVLIDNLSSIFGTDSVYSYPTDFRPDYETLQVSVEISELVQTIDGNVRLTARWNVKNLLDNDLVARTDGQYLKMAPVDNYEAIAHAVSELVARLSVDIAKSLTQI